MAEPTLAELLQGRINPMWWATPPASLRDLVANPPPRVDNRSPGVRTERGVFGDIETGQVNTGLADRDDPSPNLWRQLATYLTPYGSGYRLAQGVSERDPLTAAVGLAGIGLSMPGAWNYVASTLPNRMLERMVPNPRGTPPPSMPPPMDEVSPFWAHLIPPSNRPLSDWAAPRANILDRVGPPTRRQPPPQPPAQSPNARQWVFDEGGGLTVSGEGMRGYMHARRALIDGGGNYTSALSRVDSDAGRRVLEEWRRRGIDADQAVRYWRGTISMHNMERPRRLNSLLPLGGAGLAAGYGLTE